MNVFYADMHIHTCLSPCAEREMSPTKIVGQAIKKGLDIIAICDHNSSENVKAVISAAKNFDLSVIGGMEITSKEEVHMLGLFSDYTKLTEVQKVIYEKLPGENDPGYFGEQLVMDEEDRVIGTNNRLLIGATDLPLKEVVAIIHLYGGVALASHIDRPSFSLISQLGFIPKDLGLDGVEIFSRIVPSVPENLGIVFSSDAHRLEEIGRRCTGFFMKNGDLSEIKMALNGMEGRKIMAG